MFAMERIIPKSIECLHGKDWLRRRGAPLTYQPAAALEATGTAEATTATAMLKSVDLNRESAPVLNPGEEEEDPEAWSPQVHDDETLEPTDAGVDDGASGGCCLGHVYDMKRQRLQHAERGRGELSENRFIPCSRTLSVEWNAPRVLKNASGDISIGTRLPSDSELGRFMLIEVDPVAWNLPWRHRRSDLAHCMP